MTQNAWNQKDRRAREDEWIKGKKGGRKEGKGGGDEGHEGWEGGQIHKEWRDLSCNTGRDPFWDMEVQDVLVLFGFSAFLLVPKRTLAQAQASSTPSPKQVYPVFPRNIHGSVPGCTALLSLNPRITTSVVSELYPAPGANSRKPRSTGLFHS